MVERRSLLLRSGTVDTAQHSYQLPACSLTQSIWGRSLTHFLTPSSLSLSLSTLSLYFCCHYHLHGGSTQWSFLSLPPPLPPPHTHTLIYTRTHTGRQMQVYITITIWLPFNIYSKGNFQVIFQVFDINWENFDKVTNMYEN